MLGVVQCDKFQADNVFTSQVMVHAIGKAIRSLFADPVTYDK